MPSMNHQVYDRRLCNNRTGTDHINNCSEMEFQESYYDWKRSHNLNKVYEFVKPIEMGSGGTIQVKMQ